jgi:hypothetical protein
MHKSYAPNLMESTEEIDESTENRLTLDEKMNKLAKDIHKLSTGDR